MAVGQSALARRIEREDQEAAQAERDHRLAVARGEAIRRRTKWAIDHLLETGQITAEQHDAAAQLAITIVVSEKPAPLGKSIDAATIHTAWNLTVAAELHRIASLCSPADARQTLQDARQWVSAAPLTTKHRIALMDRLFAFPQPSWKSIYIRDRQNSAARVSSLLDVLVAFWKARPALPAGMEPMVR